MALRKTRARKTPAKKIGAGAQADAPSISPRVDPVPVSSQPASDAVLDHWAIVELHCGARYAGRITEETFAGCQFVGIQVPGGVTGRIGTGAVRMITDTDEANARRVAASANAQKPQGFPGVFSARDIPAPRPVIGSCDPDGPDPHSSL